MTDSSSETLLETPLAAEHVALGARMVPFAGWNMPVQYPEGIIAEHKHCREKVSLFDICHMGEFRVKGPNAASDLDRILARPVADQPNLVCRYNFSLDSNAGVRDDLIVYRIAQDEFYIVVNAGPRHSDFQWIKSHLSNDTSICDESDATAKLDLQGPLAAQVLERLGLPISSLPTYYKFTTVQIEGITVLLSRTGYTGELGYELYFDSSKAVQLWRKLLADPIVKPAGLGARDTLRLEMGFPLYGHEMDLTTTPVEAGFGSMLKLETPRSFIGSSVLLDSVNGTPKRKLIGLTLESRRAAREGSPVLLNGQVIGKVTSGAFGPSIDKAVAMAYVDANLDINPGMTLHLDAGRTQLPATVSPLPFYSNATARIKIS